MSRVAIFFAEGFEEIEALTVVDLCRRAGIEIDMVSIRDLEEETSSHKVVVKMDAKLSEYDFTKADMIVLPGGMPGTKNLEACAPLMAKFDEFYQAGKWIAAICAAPSIFGHRGYLKGRRACSFPKFEGELENAEVSKNSVEIDGNVITSRGMGTAIAFGLAIVGIFLGEEKAEELASTIVYR